MILAFGDSLTYGFGVAHNLSYPKHIENKTDFKVINAGVNGEYSHSGLERLSKLLNKHKPHTVILCHGANDILNRLPSSRLKGNLLAMIDLIKESAAKILFVGVPDYYHYSFDTHAIYKEVANETNVIFIDNVLTTIASDSSLRNDDVHPNHRGYELMADTFIKILKID